MEAHEIEALQKTNLEMEQKIAALTADAGKGTDEATRTRLVYLEDELKKSIEARDKAKEDKRVAEAAKLAEQGEFKTLAEQAQEKADALAKQVADNEATLAIYKKRDEAELATLLEKVPESLRESIADETLPLAKRLELAKKLIVEKSVGPGAFRAGEHEVGSLELALAEAKKSGDVAAQISIKNQMFNKQKE